jgi:hypothetical protein
MNEPAKKLPKSLIIVLLLMASLCIMIFWHMRNGFEMFNKFQPDLDNLEMPSTPGYP